MWCSEVATDTRIFRDHMIEQLYLDLAAETNDKIIYALLIKACQSAAKESFPSNNVYNKAPQSLPNTLPKSLC
jgi:hypothetical protein